MSPSPDRLPVPEEYRKFRFRVLWNGRYVAGFPDVSPLPQRLRTTDRHASGYPPPAIGPEGQGTRFFINLERGISCDHGFAQWISMVRCYGPATGKGSLLPEYKRSFTIEACDDDGTIAYVYHLFQCWVDEYRAVREQTDCEDEIGIEHLRLGFDRWDRDPPEE